ncbi:hypothetical protein [Deinococcus humi]|uniref:Uncharacterized protein n=1 Tax=Deinococcus humi TaxID=662880 RepID=A0A7W8JTR3_9DEIO|nr:hypothetical protein [Deinococcus humi]MBB5363087.1 hypothetical protein [Deinococcus humi]GGO24752.1 hypothetical protein GCM10008949_13990 [Deinococcus humi]
MSAKSGWFRHRLSGQVFEADGYQFQEALKNRDLEAVDGPGETSDETPSAKLVALRERVTGLGLEWVAGDDEDALNRKLDERAVQLRAEADQLGVQHMANWKPETLAKKIEAVRAERTKAQPPADPPPTES